MTFSEDQLHRYARHILLPEVGGIGQAKLLNAKVLVVGAGGLGAPVLLYLAAAGVGTLGIVDDDHVELSNLQRQVIHSVATVGQSKVDSAMGHIQGLNTDITVIPHKMRLTVDNVMDLIQDYDIICDGTDNFTARFLLNDACYFARKPLVSAAILRFDGQLATYKAYEEGEDRPCYRCIFRDPPAEGEVPTCAQAGVMGSASGTMGTLQATEVIKEIVGIGETMAGRLMIYDGLGPEFRTVKVRRDAGCPLCGDEPKITDLSLHR